MPQGTVPRGEKAFKIYRELKWPDLFLSWPVWVNKIFDFSVIITFNGITSQNRDTEHTTRGFQGPAEALISNLPSKTNSVGEGVSRITWSTHGSSSLLVNTSHCTKSPLPAQFSSISTCKHSHAEVTTKSLCASLNYRISQGISYWHFFVLYFNSPSTNWESGTNHIHPVLICSSPMNGI